MNKRNKSPHLSAFIRINQKYHPILFLLMLFYSVQTYGQKESKIISPASVENQLESDAEDKGKTSLWNALDSVDDAKNKFYDKSGFIVNMDYNSQIMGATSAVNNNIGASGVFRVYGKWNMIRNKKGTSEGGLVFKFENRHRYTENALREYGPIDIGFAGFMQSVYNDQRWRMTNLYWRQSFNNNKVVFYAGFVDVTDWADVHAAASPWTSFNNILFATGSGTMGGMFPDGSMGAMLNVWLNDNVYLVGSMIDINGQATQFWKSFDTFFNKFETLKTFEIGYTPGMKSAFLKNVHATIWQVDASEIIGTKSGYGIIGSASWLIGNKFMPFVRGGWAKDGGSFYEASVSAGFTYNIMGPNTLGVGLNWNRPSESTFGQKLRDQYVSEIFYKFKLTHHTEITPSVQLVANPALNMNTDFTSVFGLRFRAFL
ncbi:carbohydrate porin [Flammeovirga agarivorans]|uniref:Carbohydrate porin n=1 Tax=Flammeovirga agarivorans TaxID=2726742 RepID=A0A7X8XYC1_9BACT|nr:carbohydrate porin [Flammeovirga agarivorans]NLR93993.1 carbohydrate porin [Flammeovirga agarivorans]